MEVQLQEKQPLGLCLGELGWFTLCRHWSFSINRGSLNEWIRLDTREGFDSHRQDESLSLSLLITSPRRWESEPSCQPSQGLLQTGIWKVKTIGFFQLFESKVFGRKRDIIVQTTKCPQPFLTEGERCLEKSACYTYDMMVSGNTR